jgi:hypothetical protein
MPNHILDEDEREAFTQVSNQLPLYIPEAIGFALARNQDNEPFMMILINMSEKSAPLQFAFDLSVIPSMEESLSNIKLKVAEETGKTN